MINANDTDPGKYAAGIHQVLIKAGQSAKKDTTEVKPAEADLKEIPLKE